VPDRWVLEHEDARRRALVKNLIIQASNLTDDVQQQPSRDVNFGGRGRTSQRMLFEVAGPYRQDIRDA